MQVSSSLTCETLNLIYVSKTGSAMQLIDHSGPTIDNCSSSIKL